ncbi:hypothetical protein D3C78_1265260 [compost metagenome]
MRRLARAEIELLDKGNGGIRVQIARHVKAQLPVGVEGQAHQLSQQSRGLAAARSDVGKVVLAASQLVAGAQVVVGGVRGTAFGEIQLHAGSHPLLAELGIVAVGRRVDGNGLGGADQHLQGVGLRLDDVRQEERVAVVVQGAALQGAGELHQLLVVSVQQAQGDDAVRRAVAGLPAFIGTESKFHTVIEALQMPDGHQEGARRFCRGRAKAEDEAVFRLCRRSHHDPLE